MKIYENIEIKLSWKYLVSSLNIRKKYLTFLWIRCLLIHFSPRTSFLTPCPSSTPYILSAFRPHKFETLVELLARVKMDLIWILAAIFMFFILFLLKKFPKLLQRLNKLWRKLMQLTADNYQYKRLFLYSQFL